MKEILKGSIQLIKEFAEISVEDIGAYNRYGQLTNRYSILLSTQN